MSEREPIDTSTPWGRPRREPLSVDEARVEAERAAFRAMTQPGKGNIHPGSITTPTYEPNRAMAPDPKSIIEKKGLRPTNVTKDVDAWDKLVVYVASGCFVLIMVVIVVLSIKLG